jgi:hypothetical protein
VDTTSLRQNNHAKALKTKQNKTKQNALARRAILERRRFTKSPFTSCSIPKLQASEQA